MNWISITDKLPEDGELVLTKSELSDVDTDIDLCRYVYGRFRLYRANQPNGYGAISIREDLTDFVKFWKKSN